MTCASLFGQDMSKALRNYYANKGPVQLNINAEIPLSRVMYLICG